MIKRTVGNSFAPLSGLIIQTLQQHRNVQDATESASASEYSDSESPEESEDEYYPTGEVGTKIFKETGHPGIKFISPTYWNGSRWADSGSIRISRKFQKKQFTIVSWNVWFGLRNRQCRMEALGRAVREHDPDLIAFQEVTTEILPLILDQKWAKDYFVSDPEGKQLDNYGNVMLSKISFHECMVYKLESRMGRKAMLGNFLVQKSQPITFGTFHLESYNQDAPFRANQLKVFRDLTLNCPNVILVGDTNFTSDNESDSLGPRFKDTWRELYQKTTEDMINNMGLTFDTEQNDMAKEEYKLSRRMRLDRCFYTHDTIVPVQMKILGDQPYEGREFISDHFGIAITLELKAK